jgi:hypothetical protein
MADRDRMIRDRLYQIKKTATEIMNLINVVEADCDGTCCCCVLGNLTTPLHCSNIAEIADYPLDEDLNDDRHLGGV